MSVLRISPIKKSAVHDSTGSKHPPIAPKPKPKPRRMKNSPIFHTGLPDTEGKSLGTHVCYMRQRELLSKQQTLLNNHTVLDARSSLPLPVPVSELAEEKLSSSPTSEGPLPPPPPPSSTIPSCPDDSHSPACPDDSHSPADPTSNVDNEDVNNVADEKGISNYTHINLKYIRIEKYMLCRLFRLVDFTKFTLNMSIL